MLFVSITFALCVFVKSGLGLIKIENSIAPNEVRYRPVVGEKYVRKCEVSGPALDVLFLVDGSGSLAEKWDEQLRMVTDIVDLVVIKAEATRVAFVHYSGNPVEEFSFNTYTNKTEMLNAIAKIRPVKGVTRTATALQFAHRFWSDPDKGARQGIPRILMLLSDGRMTPEPIDFREAARIHRETYGADIYAYGLGRYLDWNPLIDIVGGPERQSRIVNSLSKESALKWFDRFQGVEECDEVPVCVPGESKPADVLFILDGSSSVIQKFQEQTRFVTRVLNSANVHTNVVRVGIIVYGTHAEIKMNFKQSTNVQKVHDRLAQLRPLNSTTRTDEALKMAYQIFAEPKKHGARTFDDFPALQRLVIIITDGRSSVDSALMAARLKHPAYSNATIVAVTLSEHYDIHGLQELTDKIYIFIKNENLVDFEEAFHQFADLRCAGLELDVTNEAEATKIEVPAVKATCDAKTGMIASIRMKNKFSGALYVVGHEHTKGCSQAYRLDTFSQSASVRAQNVPTEDKGRLPKIILAKNTCGNNLKRLPSGKWGYRVKVGVKFHDLVMTAADQAVWVECELGPTEQVAVSIQGGPQNNALGLAILKKPDDVTCGYRVIPNEYNSVSNCQLLDAQVGKMVAHRWDCDITGPLRFLVHDCIAISDVPGSEPIHMIDSDGCEVDKYIIQTPVYNSAFPSRVQQRAYMFKFPMGESVRFKCLISVCDTERADLCKYDLQQNEDQPRACVNKDKNTFPVERKHNFPIDYEEPELRTNYHATIAVESRRINVYDKRSMTENEESPYKSYCTSLL